MLNTELIGQDRYTCLLSVTLWYNRRITAHRLQITDKTHSHTETEMQTQTGDRDNLTGHAANFNLERRSGTVSISCPLSSFFTAIAMYLSPL